MSLKDLNLKASYDSDEDDILNRFYIPALSESIIYKRLAGFFTSTSFAIAAKGLAKFISSGGKIQLIANVILSKEDYEKIKEVTEKPFLDRAEKEFIDSLDNIEDELIKNHVKMLGWMLKNDKLEIKISLVSEGTGIQHQKTGILEDKEGNIISFTGSDNETKRGWIDNIESFHVFRNWSIDEKEHIESDINKFEKFWDDRAMRAKIYPVSEAVKKNIIKIAPKNDEEFKKLSKISTEDLIQKHKEKKKILKEKESTGINLRNYQNEAISNWIKNDFKGIFEMATGTGKTFTALGCLKELLKKDKTFLTVISCPYQHLITQWKKNIEEFGFSFKVIIAESDNPKWRDQVTDGLYDLKNGVIEGLIVLTTHNTFSSKKFSEIMNNLNLKSFLIVDEVHGIGAEQRKQGLVENYTYRLGLSATPDRYFDEIGTKKIRDFFGKTVFEFPIKKAIEEGYLVNYDYKPIFVELTESEINEYERQTSKIAKTLLFSKNEEQKEKLFSLLCIKRQKIITNALRKPIKFEELLSSLKEIKYCLVYCSPEQIDHTQEILNKKGIIQHRFTNEEKTIPEKQFEYISEREFYLKKFANGSYPVLVAMKCLDEGVDVPPARIAIILASSGNPKEYIQRRGRILRPYEGKKEAIIYDLIVIPPIRKILDKNVYKMEKKIFEKELIRYKEFSEAADNKLECLNNIYKVQEAYTSN